MDRITADILDRLTKAEARLASLENAKPIPRYETLAAAGAFGNAGRVIYVAADGKIYRDTGAAWKSTEIA